jgi:hypothetical protein
MQSSDGSSPITAANSGNKPPRLAITFCNNNLTISPYYYETVVFYTLKVYFKTNFYVDDENN